MDIKTGCSGWSYNQWVGPFYPPGTKSSYYLKIYSRIFDLVEVDSTFYRVPGESTMNAWKNSTPDDFTFTVKIPKSVTHDSRLKNVEKEVSPFIERMALLGKKLGCVLIQLPPSLSYGEGYPRLKQLLERLPSNPKFAVEFRHDSWFRDEVFFLLREKGVTLAWSEIPMAKVPSVITSDTVYLRLVGDRSIPEEQFGNVIKDRTSEIEYWTKELQGKKDMIRHAYVLSNNHFQGFGPATVNKFRRSIGLETVDFNSRAGQRTLL